MGSQDKHDLVAKVKELAVELGRTPNRREFETSMKGGAYQLTKLFGSYTTLLQAAGLEPLSSSNKPKTRFMEADLAEHLEKEAQREVAPLEVVSKKGAPRKKILAIGDLHYPFADLAAVEWAIGLAKKLQPDIIVQVGDAYDMLSWGSFPKSANYFTPKQEIEIARDGLAKFWRDMQAASPQAQCYLLHGNHTIRPFRQLLEKAPALEVFISMKQWFEFPDVTFIEDHRQELIIDDICFIHGYRTKLGDHRDYTLMNCVVGHTHRGGTVFRQIKGKQLFELNCGYLGDPNSKGFTYTPQKLIEWTQGVGFIDEHGPRFIPYPASYNHVKHDT